MDQWDGVTDCDRISVYIKLSSVLYGLHILINKMVDEGRPSVASIIVFAVSIPPFLVTVIFWIVYLCRRCRYSRQVTDQHPEAPAIGTPRPTAPPRTDIEQSGQYIDFQGSLGVSFRSDMYESIDYAMADRIHQERSQMPQTKAPDPPPHKPKKKWFQVARRTPKPAMPLPPLPLQDQDGGVQEGTVSAKETEFVRTYEKPQTKAPDPPPHKPKKKWFQVAKRTPKPAMPLPPLPLQDQDGGAQEGTVSIKETEFVRTYEKPVTTPETAPHTGSGNTDVDHAISTRTARTDSGPHTSETRTEGTQKAKEEDKLELVKNMENGRNIESGSVYQVVKIKRDSSSLGLTNEAAVFQSIKTEDKQELVTDMEDKGGVSESATVEDQQEQELVIMKNEREVLESTKKEDEQEMVRKIQDCGDVPERAHESPDKEEIVSSTENENKVSEQSNEESQHELVTTMDEEDDDESESTYTAVQIQRVSTLSDQRPIE